MAPEARNVSQPPLTAYRRSVPPLALRATSPVSGESVLEGEPLLYRYYSNVSHFSFLTLSGNEKRLRNVMEPPLHPPRTRPAVGADSISARLLCLLLAGRICNGMPGKYIGSFQGILNDTLKLQMYLPMGN